MNNIYVELEIEFVVLFHCLCFFFRYNRYSSYNFIYGKLYSYYDIYL